MGALPLHFLPSHSSSAGAWPGLCSHGCSWPLVWVMVGRSGRAPLGRVGRGHKSRVSPRGGGRAGGERPWAPAGGSPRPREEGRGGEPRAGGGFTLCPSPLQVSPTSPSKPTLPYWRMRYLWSRAKPSRSFISSWMAGGSSGRRAVPSLPLHLP